MHTHENEIRASVGMRGGAMQRGCSGVAVINVGAGVAVAGTSPSGNG